MKRAMAWRIKALKTIPCPTCGGLFIVTDKAPTQRVCSINCRRRASRPVMEVTPEQQAGGYRLIALNHGQVAKVDVEDFSELIKWTWLAHWNPRTNSYYAARTDDSSFMSRRILEVTDRSIVVDHEDHDTLNNRRANLRRATESQNSQNRKPRTDNRSGVPGICWLEKRQKWQVAITVDHHTKWLGYFSDLDQATEVRRRAVHEYHGEFGFKQRKAG